MKGHKFVETAIAHITAGKGGNGCMSFRREKYVPRGGPNGGDGGRGGHVIVQADQNINSLIAIYYKPLQRAKDGGHGKGKKLHGRNGKNLIFKVPCGTEIRDDETGKLLCDLVNDKEQLIIARGGNGGLGNCHWKTSSYQRPEEYTEGETGEHKVIRLELKIVADIGLIGFPNAGKSTLIRAVSNAHPRIAPYPFTTLNPVIGTIKYSTFKDLTIVDIPGIIKGAHKGLGLGHTFLRHVERSPFLVIVIDMAGVDGRNPADDYFILLNELKQHNAELAKRQLLVVSNKMDIPEASEFLKEFKQKTEVSPVPISALIRDGIDELKQALYNGVVKGKK